MLRLKVLFAAAAFAGGIVFGGSAQAFTAAPMKAQIDAARAMSPVAQAGHRKWRRHHRHHRHAWRRWNRHYGAFGHRRPRYRPSYDYDYGDGYSWGYDQYLNDSGYGYGYGDGGYGNCSRRGLGVYLGF
jgi:hypothetical protein